MDWMTQAERDLAVARHNAAGEFYEWACFISQQAAEKALKATFQHFHQVVWGHSLSEMFTALVLLAAMPEALTQSARTLDRHYVQPRCPNGFSAGAPLSYYTSKDAEEAVAHADAIIRFCNGLVARPS